MKHKKHFRNFILFLAVIFSAYLIWVEYIHEEEIGTKAEVPIMSEYSDKIVYTTDINEDVDLLKQDCQNRKGTFKTCGTICSTGSDSCPTICAYTCDLDNPKSGQEKLAAYKSYYYGFTLNYPKGTKIEDSSGSKRVTFLFWGPKQKEGDGLTDGISFSVTGANFAEGDTLRDAAAAELSKYAQIGIVEEDIQETELNGLKGYGFKAKKSESVNYVFLPKDDQHYFMIAYTVADPEKLGYNQIAEYMLNSFKPYTTK